jgi:uncharacterized protein
MRRAEKEITDKKEIAEIMQKAASCQIALVDDNYPYIVSVNYACYENHLYFHSAKEGRKIDILRKNSNVCFFMEVDTEIVRGDTPCGWGTKYKSVVGFGKAFFIENREEKIKALDYLMEKYGDTGSHIYKDDALEKVIVIDIRVEQVTGKKSGY